MTAILYSFRRCPYAMRARLALDASDQQVELREIKLRAKPDAFLAVSASGTVPCLDLPDGPIDESLDIMRWALTRNDPGAWLDLPSEGWDLIATADGPFKQALDQTKYSSRHPDLDPAVPRGKAHVFLADLNAHLATQDKTWIYGRPTLADFAILPFVRQFAFVDKALFDAQNWPSLHGWLDRFLSSPAFERIMIRPDPWKPGDPPIFFP